MLAAVVTSPGEIGLSADSKHLGELPVELRPAYVLEMIPREARYSSRQRAMVYIDAEAFLELGLKASGTAEEGIAIGEMELPVWRKITQSGGSVYEIAGLFYQGEVNPPASLPASLRDKIRADWNASFWWVEPAQQTFNTGTVTEDLFNPRTLEMAR
jgi:hypothetical protein